MSEQPDNLMQFKAVVSECDATEGTITFKLSAMPPAQAEAFQKFADRLADKGTQILVLTYNFDAFAQWHNATIVPTLTAAKADKQGSS